jgi:hypothetical protein
MPHLQSTPHEPTDESSRAELSMRPETPEELQFCKDWMDARIGAFIDMWVPICFWLNVLAGLLIIFLTATAKNAAMALGYFHLAVGASAYVWRFALKRIVSGPVFFHLVQIALIAGYSVRLHYMIENRQNFDTLIMPACTLLSLSFTMTMLLPIMRTPVVISATLLFWSMSAAAWAGHGLEGAEALLARNWMLMNAFTLAIACALELSRIKRVFAEAMGERHMRRLSAQNERLRFERDLSVAREVQDSFAPLPLELRGDGLEAACFQDKSGPLGGDWFAVRRLPTGDLVVAVADATGKGVQASLVVHAVQSLWVDALLKETEPFDPARWLANLNRVLMVLGRTKSHTLSLGIAIVNQSQVRYWSAGHPPLFVVHGPMSARQATALTARGSILGVWESAWDKPAVLSLEGKIDPHVLIGTDGVFGRGTLTRARDVLELHGRLASGIPEPLQACVGRDDKMLVWIKPAA